MKVLLLGFGKIAYMPYMNFYLDVLKNKRGLEFELIYWDRDGKPDAVVPEQIKKAYRFKAYLEEQLPFNKKLKYFAKYRRFALKILKKNKYDRIIVLHTTPGLTVMDYLVMHCKGLYILDFRDISYEYIGVYRRLVGMLSKCSAFTYVSSDAYRKFLPKNTTILTINNYQEDLLKHREIKKGEPRLKDTLRVCYWGLIRQFDVNKKIINAFGNDRRFELHYYGRMQQDGRNMEAYAKSHHFSNIYFHGQYMPSDRYLFALQTDIIHNVYDADYTTGNAMGNKYYDGIFFEIPQICTKGSYMGERISAEDVGLNISLDDSTIADAVWEYYNNIDWSHFSNACKNAVNAVIVQQEDAKQALLKFIGD